MRIVVKVGTSTLTHKTGLSNLRLVETLCHTLADIKNAGHEVLLVSSGAVGMGMGKLMLKERPEDMPTKQAAAAVGQSELMQKYDNLFARDNHTVAQILLTNEDLHSSERRFNIENTLNRLLELGVIPIINENDTVATEEISVGDNDTLSAIVATSVNANLLVLLTDIDGLYSADPRVNKDAKLIDKVHEITPEIMQSAQGTQSKFGTGGMITKLQAAKKATEKGVNVIIANGKDPTCLYDVIEGKNVGTLFVAKEINHDNT